jgi:hypothetical protein
MSTSARLRARLARVVAASGVATTAPATVPRVEPGDVEHLPDPARRYLRFMRAVDAPRDWSFEVQFAGRFRLRAKSWMPALAWQYNTAPDISRTFVMRLRFAGMLPMTGTDTYRNGTGRMHGTLLGLVPVANGSGDEFDVGELTTYLNDAVLLAPTFLLGPDVEWRAVDGESFDLTLTDAGRAVTARVVVDERGAPVDFSSDDRYADLPGGLVRARWSTPIDRWSTTADGRPVPVRARAIWHLPDGPLPYLEGGFVADTLRYNEPPTPRPSR